jgi:hypothetical protein
VGMKILVISNYRPYHTARPEAEIFIGLAKLGLEIDIMTYGDAAYFEKFKEAGINVIDFHPEKKMDKGEIAFIRIYIGMILPHIPSFYIGVSTRYFVTHKE